MEMRAIIAEISRAFGSGAVKTGEIYPTNVAPILTMKDRRLAPSPVKWGFPKWQGSGVIINARSESALEKRTFSKPLLTRRCVIPSTGFYEWANAGVFAEQQSLFPEMDITKPQSKAQKVKLMFRRPGEDMLYMAGMVNTFSDESGNAIDSFVILTTGANDSMAPFHDRMPVILSADEREDWIGSDSFMREVISREGPELVWEKAS